MSNTMFHTLAIVQNLNIQLLRVLPFVCVQNAPMDVSVSKSSPGVILPDPGYREGATPSWTLPPARPTAVCRGALRTPPPGIWAGYGPVVQYSILCRVGRKILLTLHSL